MTRWTARSLIALLIVSGAAQAEILDFTTPAQFDGQSSTSPATTILIAIPPTADWSVRLQADAGAVIDSHQVTFHGRPVGYDAVRHTQPLDGGEESATPAVTASQTGATSGWAFLRVDGFVDAVLNGTGLIDAKQEDEALDLPRIVPQQPLPANFFLPDSKGIQFALQSPGPLQLEGSFNSISFHNISIPCKCPAAEWYSDETVPGAQARTYLFRDWLADGSLWMTTSAYAYVILPEGSAASIEGSLRLPRASSEQTLRLEGTTNLTAMETLDRATLRTDLDGSWTRAAWDEAPATGLVGNLQSTVAVTGGIGAIVFLGWLVSRHLREGPLENLTRQRIFEATQASGGITFRGLQRELGLANGQLHYHLNVLEAGAVLTSNRAGKHKVYRTPHTCVQEANQARLLRREPLRTLYDCAKAMGPVLQPTLISLTANELGWPRTTTAYRVKTLLKSGLIKQDSNGCIVVVA